MRRIVFAITLLFGLLSAQAQLGPQYQTPKLKFYIPPKGYPNWDVVANGNMTMLEGYLTGDNSAPWRLRNSGTFYIDKNDGTHLLSIDQSGNLSLLTGSFSGTIAGYLPLAGGTMTGAIVLPADPTTGLQATTKQYVDNHVPNLVAGDGIAISTGGGTTTISSGPSFTINSFTTPTTLLEIGTTLTNPTFSAAYSVTPTVATITNTDSISSPTTLSSPFTSGSVTGSFVKHSASSTTFTLNATGNGVPKTQSTTVSWNARTFGGVGTTGATSCSASSNNCTLNTSGTLTDAGVVTTVVNKVYGPYSPTGGQKIYVATPGSCTHSSWTDTVSGFALVMDSGTSFTFTNQHSDSVGMCLYATVNTYISGSYSPRPNN